jgi:hypothetical protein
VYKFDRRIPFSQLKKKGEVLFGFFCMRKNGEMLLSCKSLDFCACKRKDPYTFVMLAAIYNLKLKIL